MNAPTELKHTLTNDVLFKMFFRDYPDLLKRLVAAALGIRLESIEDFVIRNPEIPPEIVGSKFCRLDICTTVDGMRVNLEIQVRNEGDFPDRTLFNWAREYSTALKAGSKNYSDLPRTIVISIIEFPLFDCAEFYSEFRPLEVTRYTLLSDKMCLQYFELSKLPDVAVGSDELNLWLALFKAKTEDELIKIQSIGGTVMTQAVQAYRHVSTTEEFMMLERMREDIEYNETTALANAERRGKREGKIIGERRGELKGTMNVARKMKAEGIDTDTVIRITGLTIDDIMQL